MAEIIDVPVLDLDLSSLQAEAEETGKTIKDLKQEIKEFRDSLEGVEIGSEEFKSALEQLTNAQNELKQATKSSLDVVEGSYNALTRQMAEMKAEWKNLNPATEEGQKRMAELGKQINDTNNKLKEMDASLGNYQRNVGNYGSAFEGVSMKIEGSTASFEKQVTTTQAALDSFQLIEGAMQTMGIQSEETEKILRSVEGAMRFTQGLKAVREAKDGFKDLGIATKAAELQQKLFGTTMKATAAATNTATKATNTFKKALISTGIGALIVGIGVLIANFDKVMGLFERSSAAADRANESYQRLSNTIRQLSTDMDTELKIMAINGASELDILARETELTKEAIRTLQDKLTLERLKFDSLRRWEKDAKETSQKTIEETEEQLTKLQERLYLIPEDVKVAQARAQEELRKSIQANFKQSSDAMDKLSDKLKQWGLSKPALDLMRLSEQVDKDRKDLETALDRNVITYEEYTKRLKKIDDNYKSDKESIFQSLYDEAMDLTMSEEDRQLKKLDEEKKAYEQKWKDAYNILVSNNNTTAEEIESFNKMQAEALAANNKIYEDNVKNVKKLAKDNSWKGVIESTEKDLEKLDKLRERAVQKLALTEIAINEEFEGFDFDLSVEFEFGNQEEKLKKMKTLYENQLETLKEIDAKERERLQTAINQAIEQGRSTEEIEELRQQLAQVGGESDALVQKIGNVNDSLQTLTLDKLVAQVESISSLFSDVGDAFKRLNEIGDAFNSETASGIDETISQIAGGLNQAAVNFSQIGKMQEELRKLQEESADSAKQQRLQTELAAKQWGTYGHMATAGLGAASSMLSALAAQQDQQDEEGFEKMKKLQIASATMSMLQGVVSAVTSAMSPNNAWMTIWGQAGVAAAMSAMVVSTGVTQINAIKKMSKNSPATNTTPSVANIPAPSALNSISPAVQTVNAVEGASVESNIKDTRVYVVETDIASTMNKVNVIESEATY